MGVACLVSSIPRAPMRIIGAPSTRNRHVAPIVRNAASLPPFLPHVFPSFLFVLGQRHFPKRCYASTSITCAALHPVQADHAPTFVFQLRLPSSLPFLFFQLAYRLRLVPVSAMRCINSPSCPSSSLWRASVDSVQELRFFLSSLLFAISVRVIFRVLAFIPFAFEFESDDVNTPFSMSSPIFWHLLRLKHDFR